MTLDQFRKNESLVEWWTKTYSSPRFSTLLQMLQDEHPLRKTSTAILTSVEASSNYMHMIQGYELALQKLLEATKPVSELASIPEATFEPPTKDA